MRAAADQEFADRWIRPARPYPGDPNARIVDTGIPVWALVGHYKANGKHPELTAEDYHLPLEAIEATVAYHRLHRELIDARLVANETALD